MTGCLFERHIIKAFLSLESQKIANGNIPSWGHASFCNYTANEAFFFSDEDTKLHSPENAAISDTIYNCISLVHDSSLLVLSAVALSTWWKQAALGLVAPTAKVEKLGIYQQGISGQTMSGIGHKALPKIPA